MLVNFFTSDVLYLFITMAVCFIRLTTAVDNAIVSIIPAGTRSCYYEDLIAGRTLEVEFDVFKGGNMDITFIMKNPKGEILKYLPMKRSEFFDIEVKLDGVHEFCLDNVFSRFAEKVVSFEYFDNRPMADYDTAYEDLDSGSDTESLEMKVVDIFEAIDNIRLRIMRIMQHQTGRRSTEARDRNQMDSTLVLVDRTSLLSLVLMFMSTAAQIALIRAMFNSPHRSSSKSSYNYGGATENSGNGGFPNMFSNGLGR